jgi:hypothetical protein
MRGFNPEEVRRNKNARHDLFDVCHVVGPVPGPTSQQPSKKLGPGKRGVLGPIGKMERMRHDMPKLSAQVLNPLTSPRKDAYGF